MYEFNNNLIHVTIETKNILFDLGCIVCSRRVSTTFTF